MSLNLESILHTVYHDRDNCILSNFVLAFANFSTKLSAHFIFRIGTDSFMDIKAEFKEDNCFLKKLKSKSESTCIILTCLCLFLSVAQGGVALLTNQYTITSICVGTLDVIIVKPGFH